MLILDEPTAIASASREDGAAAFARDEILTCEPCEAQAVPAVCEEHGELIIELL